MSLLRFKISSFHFNENIYILESEKNIIKGENNERVDLNAWWAFEEIKLRFHWAYLLFQRSVTHAHSNRYSQDESDH